LGGLKIGGAGTSASIGRPGRNPVKTLRKKVVHNYRNKGKRNRKRPCVGKTRKTATHQERREEPRFHVRREPVEVDAPSKAGGGNAN